MTKATYEKAFFNALEKNLLVVQEQLDKEDGHLVRSIRNTCLFARALQKTFGEMADVPVLFTMVAACDYSPLEGEAK